ncbi:MAG TPA: hypothetical protein ENO03_06730 [Candidatus Aminicenantes bacterium]|nr:hypothetical protein [Candidatus Aminicenantes bacterium]
MADWYFIQGIHRSGTTILGTWLHETGAFRTLTLGRLLDISDDPVLAAEFAVALEGGESDRAELKALLGKVTRQFDHVHVTRDMFEEYSHLTMSEPPFSRGVGLLAAPRPWKQFHPRHVFRLGPGNMESFRVLSRILGDGDGKPQLFKSPFDVSNPFVYGLPAKHIFVFREPVDILVSMIKQVENNYRRRNPYVAAVSRFYRESYACRWYRTLSLLGSTPLGIRVLARRIVTDLEGQMNLMEGLDQASYVCVDYEYMCQDEDGPPEQGHPHRDHTLAYILRSFGFDTGGVRNVRSRTKRRNNHRPPVVEALRPLLDRRLERYRRKMLEVRQALESDFRASRAGVDMVSKAVTP